MKREGIEKPEKFEAIAVNGIRYTAYNAKEIDEWLNKRPSLSVKEIKKFLKDFLGKRANVFLKEDINALALTIKAKTDGEV